MADHFSVIGFKAKSPEALSALVSNLLERGGEKEPCPPGYYHRLRSKVGPELWVHMQKTPSDQEAEPYVAVGITPFFEGEGRTPIRVRAMRQRPSDNLFEGAFYVELGPTIALIDVVDFARFAGKPVPFMAMAQIVAFPHELAVFESEAAFQETQADKQVKFTPRSFLASGLFMNGGGSGDIVFLDPEAEDFRAPARAFLTGEVQKTERRRNPETGQDFTWALIGTAGGTFDLVADDTVLPKPLKQGMIVEGEFWLCGRLVETYGAA
ncbi:MAG TPA: hypothetical protein VE986_03975 [Hyphomicrobiales bacterium]|nr:hypothetical protein [Hyphomicrobiales bacterium]